ncbi:hypothetical protein [cf. Phormidesmis sp. LEGE 11477]|uniref:hypothetical protein n=1 Tax=cf. Phormidesmis sp. LEGE 11477 TaxID=1828680 RepID=UPI001D156221|nr:hypothetical protein [cf. Phormidesmis sp. LEGE 11477]
MISSEMTLDQARLESVKSGLIGASVVGFVSMTVMLGAVAVELSLPIPGSILGWVVNLAVAIASGFFFGVTYRYIVRQDDNLHLGGGAVGAFALVRSLAQIEATWDDTFTFIPWLLVTGESFLWFVSARYALDFAISRQWIEPVD